MNKIKELERKVDKLSRSSKMDNFFWLIILGAILNITVVVFNGNVMPVFYEVEEEIPNLTTLDYIAFTDFDEVRYPLLSDFFHVNLWKYGLRYSIGDLLMVVGVSLCVVQMVGNIINSRRYKNGIVIGKGS